MNNEAQRTLQMNTDCIVWNMSSFDDMIKPKERKRIQESNENYVNALVAEQRFRSQSLVRL